MTDRRFSFASAIPFALSAFLLLGALATGCATGGAASTEGGGEEGARKAPAKVVLAVRKPKHVKVGMKTASQMLSGGGSYDADRVDIVACGPAIRALAGDSKLAAAVKRSLEEGVRIKACGLTVEKMGFDRSRFIEGVEVVPNGLTEIVRLQSEGFHSVEL